MNRLAAPSAVRPGFRATPAKARRHTERTREARRGTRTTGAIASSGGTRPARHTGSRPAAVASNVATGVINASCHQAIDRPRTEVRSAPIRVPASPATTPRVRSSTNSSWVILRAGQPRQARTPSSLRLEWTAATVALARKTTQTSRTRPNRARLLVSMALSREIATPFLTQPSFRVSGGRPYLPAGRLTSSVVGELPTVMSTSRPVCRTICAATRRTRAWESLSTPCTPATRILMALIGAFWTLSSSMNPSPRSRGNALRVVSISGGCWR